jgi:hypothetical protein
MQRHGQSTFENRFAAQAADSDYSKHAKLRDSTNSDILAAAEALWNHLQRNRINLRELGGLDEEIVITAMLAQAGRWEDEDELVSTEFQDYWDQTDTFNFSYTLREQIKNELTISFLASKHDAYIVVNNRQGIWLFDKAEIWADHQAKG